MTNSVFLLSNGFHLLCILMDVPFNIRFYVLLISVVWLQIIHERWKLIIIKWYSLSDSFVQSQHNISIKIKIRTRSQQSNNQIVILLYQEFWMHKVNSHSTVFYSFLDLVSYSWVESMPDLFKGSSPSI